VFSSTAGGPYPDFGSNRNNFYGFVNRDFFKVKQDIGTVSSEVYVTPDLMLSDKIRVSRSVNDYIGTLAESPTAPIPLTAATVTANPQSRYQVTDVIANQSEATYKFDTGGFRHTALGGVEISRETSFIDKYAGLNSEVTTGPSFTSGGSTSGVSVFAPQYTFLNTFDTPRMLGAPTNLSIDTKSVYAMDSANYRDLVILNGGIRYDDYTIKTSGYGNIGPRRCSARRALSSGCRTSTSV